MHSFEAQYLVEWIDNAYAEHNTRQDISEADMKEVEIAVALEENREQRLAKGKPIDTS